ncbi:MAG: hypothetical protein KDE51_07515 [Anaerolineales bacterium]|nr:hypothetical protein [Anaerolineales bacterium]
MNKVELLKIRLEEIGRSLEATGKALALIGLGSAGREQERLDDYSDLDFFAIVQRGHKEQFINDLSWLSSIHPIAYAFQNTADGYKLLFADGVFCEFAVFEQHELKSIPFAAAKIIWADRSFDFTLIMFKKDDPEPAARPVEWVLGEALTNLYVGLGRFRRGEKITAVRFVEGYAVDRVLELMTTLETPQPAYPDIFQRERRFEQRYPQMAQQLPAMMQGYERVPQSAVAILAFLDEYFEVNGALKNEILQLCEA